MNASEVLRSVLEHGVSCDTEFRNLNIYTRIIRLIEAGEEYPEIELIVNSGDQKPLN